MQSAMAESESAAAAAAVDLGETVTADTRGKHRLLAELKRLEQETKSLQEELDELEKTENVSAICMELLRNIEASPDPLLPVTIGPPDPTWDKWFEGLQDVRDCSCWIL